MRTVVSKRLGEGGAREIRESEVRGRVFGESGVI